MDSAGNLYGTTYGYGPYGAGVVYELLNHGGGSYKYEVIHAFTNGKGGGPMGDLVRFKGSLFGVTYEGGGGGCQDGCGTVYGLAKSGGKWVETVLHVFNDRGDGNEPSAGVALDSGGNIYGTTYAGGSFGFGIVFKLSRPDGSLELPPESNGSYKETILHTFVGAAQGCLIVSGVVLDSAGNLYGTASQCGDYGDGTVYQLKRSSSKYEFRVILTFNGANGAYPSDSPGHLAIDSRGNVYGITSDGGASNLRHGVQVGRGELPLHRPARLQRRTERMATIRWVESVWTLWATSTGLPSSVAAVAMGGTALFGRSCEPVKFGLLQFHKRAPTEYVNVAPAAPGCPQSGGRAKPPASQRHD